jgi:Kef-type K+ transport system membrane component KefB
MLELFRDEIVALMPPLAKFSIGLALILIIPRLSRRARLPPEVGLLLSGVIFGPYVLDVFGEHRPIADFFWELGKLLLMFFVGLEINLTQFHQQQLRSIAFGLVTTLVPLLFGTALGHWLGYGAITSIVIGSLLASHTLLGISIVNRLGAGQLQPIVVTDGATMVSDTLSLVVFAICVPAFVGGFTVTGLAVQIVEIAVFVPLVLLGLGRLGARVLRSLENDEDGYFIMIFAILALTALLAEVVKLPGIVGTFLAGLAINAAVRDKPSTEKLHFFGKSLFSYRFFSSRPDF